jgi:arginyl-tRNA synthetase
LNIFNIVRVDIIKALGEVAPEVQNIAAVTAEPPRDASHGDIATNAAMVIAKQVGKNPREIAEELKEKLAKLDYIEKIEVAGPGFINLSVTNAKWRKIIKHVLENGIGYGNCKLGNNEKINVEYVSANPTGPMHIGHARGAVYGDALARLLQKAGFDVTKEYYINDAGGQIDKLVKSAYLRFLESIGEDIGEFPDNLYPGDYLVNVGEAFAEEFGRDIEGQKEADILMKMRPFVLDSMMNLIKSDLALLDIHHDIFTSEKNLVDSGKVEEALELLDKNGLIYKGVLEPPKGKTPDDWEPREQTLFKATDFGDDIDRALKKNDGSNTYFSSDIAYHFDKIKRGFKNMVLILGADHGGYQKRLKAAVRALSGGEAELNIKLYQLVNFLEDGKPAKMSKRAGTFLTVQDVVEAVGKDVVRFIMLTRKNDAVLDFDFKTVTEQSKDNPVFYVQYAHARANSVLRNAMAENSELNKDALEFSDEILSHLKRDEEIEVIKAIANWPRVVELAASHQEPHRIVFYLMELAGVFHSFWNKGKEDDSLRFIVNDDIMLTKARLILVKALATIIASGLQVIGVEPVERM